MKIKNLTPKMQELKLIALDGGSEFSVYVEGHGEADVVDAIVSSISLSSSCFSIVGREERCDALEEACIENEPADHMDITEEDAPSEAVGATVLEEKFICDICGAEFASARGLVSHKNRSHAE